MDDMHVPIIHTRAFAFPALGLAPVRFVFGRSFAGRIEVVRNAGGWVVHIPSIQRGNLTSRGDLRHMNATICAGISFGRNVWPSFKKEVNI